MGDKRRVDSDEVAMICLAVAGCTALVGIASDKLRREKRPDIDMAMIHAPFPAMNESLKNSI